MRSRARRAVGGAFGARAARSRVGLNWFHQSIVFIVSFNIGGVTMSVAFGRLERRRGRLRRGDADVRYDNDEYDNTFYAWCTGEMSGVA